MVTKGNEGTAMSIGKKIVTDGGQGRREVFGRATVAPAKTEGRATRSGNKIGRETSKTPNTESAALSYRDHLIQPVPMIASNLNATTYPKSSLDRLRPSSRNHQGSAVVGLALMDGNGRCRRSPPPLTGHTSLARNDSTP
jgi:hypothetical protein